MNTATITFSLTDMLGVAFDVRRTKMWVDTNIPGNTILDTVANKTRIGTGNVTIASDGTGSVVVWVPSTGSNPSSWQTNFHIDYPDRNAPGGRVSRVLGPFTVTANIDLADLVSEQAIPPNYSGAGLIATVSAIAGLTGEDAAIANLDANAASLFRVSQDARLSALYARKAYTTVNVKAYGATGDGTTDDTTAVQSAINAALGPVFFPPGTYKLTTSLTLPAGTTLRGSGIQSKIKQSTNTYALRATSVNNITIDGLWVEGFGTASTIDQGAIHISGGTGHKVTNCRISNHGTCLWIITATDVLVSGNEIDTFRRYGAVLSTSSYWRVVNNRIHGSDEAGAGNAYCISASSNLAITQPQNGCLIANNQLYDVPAWDAIMTHETNDLTISNNWINNVRTGIDVGPNGGSTINTRLVISGNVIKGTSTNTWGATPATNAGISLIGDATYPVREVTISGNQVEGFNKFAATTGSGGVLLVNVRNIAVTGNQIRDLSNVGGSNQGGITMAGTVRGVTISGNQITDTGLVGVSFYNISRGQGINVTGNTFRKDVSTTMAAGVLFDSTRLLDCSVNNNVIEGLVQHVTQGGTAYLPLPPHTDIMYGGQLALAHPRRDPISRVGSVMAGDTLLAKVRVCTFRLDTTATATAAAGATSVTVASNTNILASDTFYAVLDDGSWHSSNVTGIGAGTITLTTAVPASRSIVSGNEVWVVRWTNGA